MSTKDEAERLAEEHFDRCVNAAFTHHLLTFDVPGCSEAFNELSSFKAGFRAGEKSERVMRLIKALENWIAFEEDQINQYGPYDASLKIPERMDEARRVLESFNASPEET